MRHASWASPAISLCLLLLVGTAAPAADSAIRIEQAEFLLQQPADIGPIPRKLGQLPQHGWRTVSLPHVRKRTLLTRAENERALIRDSVTAWYRMTIPAELAAEDIQALYIPRWYTWGRLAIYADDELIFNSRDERTSPSLNETVLTRIALRSATRNRPQQIVMRMDGIRVIGGLLSSIWIGPFAELQELHAARHWLQVGIPQVASATLLALGIFALFLWLARRRETVHLLFFVLSALFFLRNFRLFVDDWLLSERWFAWISVCAQGWLTVVTYIFALRFLERRRPRVEWALLALMLLLTAISVPLTDAQRSVAVWGSAAYVLFAVIRIGAATSITFETYRARSLQGAWLAAALWLSIGLGVYDWRVQTGRGDPEGVFLGSLGSVAVFAVFLYALLRRYGAALSTAEQANTRLQTTLTQREHELAESYAKLRRTEHEQLLSDERQRLMREMHDGLGSALMSSLVAVERGQMQPSEIAQVLRECVDDLKLTIDSLDPAGDDLLVLLATLRYRLEPRLEAAGLRLHWDVRELPRLTWLNPSTSLQILRMVQEVLTNVLKHARAKHIQLSTSVDADNIVVTIEDDGAGFVPEAVAGWGRGLANLQRRATEIGGRVHVASSPGATCVTIVLPVRSTAQEIALPG